ncbi:MAG TPA: prolyl oligopeptidase family serine peptidase [Candidatus Acidoferrum sp.]|nr:prolyl oligopeptidase family serine peptidase [Candidatus Acidoferrum sp.]
MRWLEQRIRRYEHARWTTDDNRRVLPFEWGLEHIGGRPNDPDPRGFLKNWVPKTIAHSDEWFRARPATDYRFEKIVPGRKGEGALTFTSAVKSPWPENNRVSARFLQARKTGAAIVMLPQWNAKWDGQLTLCRWLNALGISVLKLTMPYHDRRAIPGHDRADYLVGSNIGLTLQANRQAVTDTRQCLAWLAEQGYDRLGLVGISIGSSVGSITMAHEPLVRSAAFLHVSTYFGDVVRTGMNTSHVWEGMRGKITAEELRNYWSPISPMPYLHRLGGGKRQFLAVAGDHDPTFLPEFTYEMFAALRANKVPHETLVLPCGHYSLELTPFAHVAAYRIGTYLMQQLA